MESCFGNYYIKQAWPYKIQKTKTDGAPLVSTDEKVQKYKSSNVKLSK